MPNFHRKYVFLFILSGFIMFIYSIVIMVLGGSCNEKPKIDYKKRYKLVLLDDAK
jgi:uncharacterized protein YhhL (DUF1145 family)